MSQGQVAKALNVSSSLVSYLEGGTRGPQIDQAKALDRLFETSGTFERLWKTVSNHAIYPVGSRTSIDFERIASEVREYHTVLIPGLAQTAAYARATYTAMRPFADEAAIQGLVASRMKRQEILEGPDRPLLWMVLDENVIRRVLGDAATMKEQLGHLLEMVEGHVLRLQIVPLTCRLPPGLSGPFRLFAFRDRPMVASAEYVLDDLVIDEAEQVRECASLFGAIQAEALSVGDSVELVRLVKGELDG